MARAHSIQACLQELRDGHESREFILFGDTPVPPHLFRETFLQFENRLCTHVAPGDLVAVKADHGWRWIAAMLAVWAADAVYVPVGDNFANDSRRLDFQWLLDCGSSQYDLIRLSTSGSQREFEARAGYLLPTSGSTGEPKYIIGDLTGVEEFIRWEISEFRVTSDDVVSQLTPPTFDPVFRDVLVPLLGGARLAMPESRSSIVDHAWLRGWLSTNAVSIIHTVPTLLRAWATSRTTFNAPSLRIVALAGESLFGSDIGRVRNSLGERTDIYNLYGPSETTLACCAYRISDMPPKDARVPVGRAIAGNRIIVLDESNGVCSPYEVGEVHIRASHPSLGYWRLPEQTASRFIANPLVPGDQRIVFKSGDLGFLDSNNNLVLTGRADDQFKHRGSRIALGSIENAIRSIDGVKEAAICVQFDSAQLSKIAAFVQTNLTIDELRSRLVGRIADNSWPNSWTTVTEFPKTVSGKIDRARLLELHHPLKHETVVADPITKIVLDVLESVVPLGQTPRSDQTLADLGVKSMERVQLLLGIEERLGVKLALDDLYELGTIDLLVSHISKLERTMRNGAPSLSQPDDPRVYSGAPLTGAQHRFWRWMDGTDKDDRFYFPFAARLVGPVDTARLQHAVLQTLRTNDAIQVRFEETQDGPRQLGHDFGVEVPVVETGSSVGVDQVIAIVRQAAATPYRIGEEPLMRAQVFRISPSEHVLLLVNHILASDGWTKGIILKQISEGYAGTFSGQAASFLKHANHEHEMRSRWAEHLPYWSSKLGGVGREGALFSRSPNNQLTHRLRSIKLPIDLRTSNAITARAASVGCTVPSVFLGAMTSALSSWANRAHGHILLSNSKRLSPHLNGLVGCLTDSLLLAYEQEDNLLRHVLRLQTTLGQSLLRSAPSFEYLVKTLRPDIDHREHDWFPAIFAPQREYTADLHMPDVRVEEVIVSDSRWIWPIEVYPMLERRDGFELNINYSIDLFEDDVVDRFASNMMELLVSFASA